jgi:ATP-dependent DNA helicase DinG
MAKKVLACLKNNRNLLVEAGTGVGKSFAYLIPAILSGEKTIVSTASIALQDQLVNKDLVFLQKNLPEKFSFAILKGKNNYLCLKREREFQPELGKPYKEFLEWVAETDTGDKDELPFIPDFWNMICGDSDDCSGVQCPFYSNCFYYKHYRSLYKKDILVINHHLLICDILSGFSLLPFHKQLIIDEAHQLENVISHVLGSTLSYSRTVWLLYRLRGLKTIAVDHLFEPVESFFKRRDILSRTVYPVPHHIIEELKNLKKQLALDKVIHRLNAYKESAPDDELKDRTETTIAYVNSLDAVIDDFIAQGNEDKVYYMIENKKTIELRSNLVESRSPFGELVSAYDSVIMTSATLTAGNDFVFFKKRLGITDLDSDSEAGFEEMIVDSPFEDKRQCLLYIDKKLPPPVKGNSETFQQEGLKTIEELIRASRGRALVLFTSYNHLHFVSENIDIEYPFKTQGEMPPAKLIQWFKNTPNSVLLATATFWQGIDVKGESLSLVVIVKIPFGSPGDPVYDERCRRLGERWFSELALPSAILLLRQGFGRLIRGVDDYGVVAILDTRLITSSYGNTVIASLPEVNIVHKIEDVKKFFNSVSLRIYSGLQRKVNLP